MNAAGPSLPRWRKSGFSGDATNCVEIAHLDHAMGVRDSKNPGPALTFARSSFSTFLRTR